MNMKFTPFMKKKLFHELFFVEVSFQGGVLGGGDLPASEVGGGGGGGGLRPVQAPNLGGSGGATYGQSRQNAPTAERRSLVHL